MSTGIEVMDNIGPVFNNFKLKKPPNNYQYIIYAINEDKKIVIEKTGERGATWDDFTKELPPNDCRYAVMDVGFQTDDGRQLEKIVFISWAPETASVRPKMIYAGSKEAIRRALVGVAHQLNLTDQAELEFNSVLQEVKRFK